MRAILEQLSYKHTQHGGDTTRVHYRSEAVVESRRHALECLHVVVDNAEETVREVYRVFAERDPLCRDDAPPPERRCSAVGDPAPIVRPAGHILGRRVPVHPVTFGGVTR